jgi:hypothetical protein
MRKRYIFLVILIVVGLAIVGFLLLRSSDIPENSDAPDTIYTSADRDEGIEQAFAQQETITNEVRESFTNELSELKSSINTVADIKGFIEDENQLVYTAVADLSRELLEDNESTKAFEYLDSAHNDVSKSDSDFMFYYYISARDSGSDKTSIIRNATVELINTQNDIEPVTLDIDESFFSVEILEPPTGDESDA